MQPSRILSWSCALALVMIAGSVEASPAPASGSSPASVSVPSADIPKVPTADAATLEPPQRLLHFRRVANFAQQSQELEDEISLLKLQSEVSALKKKIREDQPASARESAGALAGRSDNYVTTVVGFRGHWRADLYLNGHGYWVSPGDETPLGRVVRISGSGVWVQGPHGRVLVGMKSDANSGAGASPDFLPSATSAATASVTKPAVVSGPENAASAHPLLNRVP